MYGKILGELLRGYRKEAGWTQEKTARACGVKQETISKLETGKIKDPPVSLILSYAKAIGIPKEKLFARLDEMEIKELLPEEIEKKEYPPKAKKEVLRYAIGIEFQKKGIISFPEYAKTRVKYLLFSLTPEERGKYLSFAEEYFKALKAGEELGAVSERYKAMGLNQALLLKIKKIVARAYKREIKRAEKKVIPTEKEKRMIEGYAKDRECQERFSERVRGLIFKTKGMTSTHLKIYLTFAREFYRLLKKAKGKIPLKIIFKEKEVSFAELGFKEIEEWRERKIKEGGNPEILNQVMKIVAEEYYRVFFFAAGTGE